ncbi:MAG: PAS domain-containing protein [Alphaproteobacteria bacterium]
MTKYAVTPTGIERTFGEEELIVSKTDLKGRITYANDVFARVSQYSVKELIGAAHSIVRHPDMPRCAFKLLWDTIEAKREIFAYVLNMAKSGDHYWVFAQVTPSFDPAGTLVGYHSNRRRPDPNQIATIKPIYAALLAEENRYEDRRLGIEKSTALLAATLRAAKVAYDQFVLAI